MGRIRVLPDAVANQIAAGEVVERPASVVKELLENSLDAGANNLRVEIEAGGRRLVRLADDGCGMMRDDALLAFERHATSKLADIRDLLSIATLGFRGEALPSIGSVSRLTLETRTADEQSGTRVEIAGGRILQCEDLVRAAGTTITVRDLFYNVPARKKFLRSDQTELAHIAALVTHYSLAHNSKSFTLVHNDRELLDVAPVDTLRERVYQVFGTTILDDLTDLGDQNRLLPAAEDGLARHLRLRGFVSGPHVQKLNRNSVYLFVNGRLIRDRLLLHAISAAYHNLMPAGCFPFALLFLDCDLEEVDVNVHPAKTEVRFRHGSLIHDFVRDTVREVLMAARPVSGIATPAQPAAQLPYSEYSQRVQSFSDVTAAEPASEEVPSFTLMNPSAPSPRFEFDEPQAGEQPPAQATSLRLPVPDTHGHVFPDGAIPEPQSLEGLKDLRPLGQLHDSFIIAAGRDGLWIIDQHVAHERILFEQILTARGRGRVESQGLLLPLVISLSAAQQVEYARIAGELKCLGFDTEPFGNRTIAVKAAPAGVDPGDVEKILFEVLETSEREFRKSTIEEQRAAIAASIACRAAIKIHMRLEPAKVDWLIRSLAATSSPMTCPHGRPIALRYSTRDILRSFHRI